MEWVDSKMDGDVVNAQIDNTKNFLTIYEPPVGVYDQSYTLGEKQSMGSKGGRIRYMRWGWFEDNILSKYLSMVGANTKNPIITFRSIENPIVGGERVFGLKESVKIADYYLLRAIDPSHSLIFKPGIFQDNTSLNSKNLAVAYESYLARINAAMIGEDYGPSRGFRVDNSPHDEKSANNLGYLRNIFINVDVIQKHFGITVDATEKGNANKESIANQYVFNGVQPNQSVRNSILNLMAEVSKNFFGAWQFQISEDTEDPNNSMLKDLTAAGKDQFSFSEFNESEDVGLELVNQGVYKFPSFRMDSTVKGQELEINIGDNLQYLSTLSNSTYETVVSGNPDLNKFQRFADLSRIGAQQKKRKDRLTNLSKGTVAHPNAGYEDGEANSKYNKNGGYNHPNNIARDFDKEDVDDTMRTWFKYAPKFGDDEGGQRDDGEPETRPIGFNSSTNGFQYMKTIDLGQAVAEGDEAALNQAAEALGDGITSADIKAQFSPSPIPEPEPTTDPDVPITVGVTKKTVITYDKNNPMTQALLSTDLAENNDALRGPDDHYEGVTMADVMADSIRQGIPVVTEVEEKVEKVVEKEKEEDPAPPPKEIKVNTVTVGTEQVETVYQFNSGKSSKMMIERLRIKPYVRKAISQKMVGGASDSKNLVAPFDFVEMSLEIDGIGGIVPGHTFHSDYMPLKYNKRVYASGGVDVGSPVFFLVTEHSQTVTDAGWTTKITGQMCNNPDAQRVLNQMSEEKLAEQFKLNASRAFGIESLGPSSASKIGKYIDVAGKFLVDAKAYIDTNYGNTANGFSLNEYAKNQGIAKAIADAETEEDRDKLLESLDIDVEAIGDYTYDGGIFENLAASVAITAGIGVAAGAQVAVGAGTIAYGAGKGIGATAARLDRDPVGIFPEWNLIGKGAQKIKEIKIKETGKTEKGLLPSGAAVDAKVSPKTAVSDDVNLEKEIAKQNDKKEKGKREEGVAEATGQEIMPLEKLVSLITYTVENQNSTPAAGGVGINVSTTMVGAYKGSPIKLTRTQTGEGTLKEVGNINQKFLKQDIANAFKERYPGSEILLDNSAAEDEPPPAPFLQATFDAAPFGEKEPRWETALACRLELAAKFGNSTYKAYTDEYDKDKRLEHWKNSKELHTANPGSYTDSLNAQKVSVTTPQPIMDYGG